MYRMTYSMLHLADRCANHILDRSPLEYYHTDF